MYTYRKSPLIRAFLLYIRLYVSLLNKINAYIDRNFYPFIITVVAHVIIGVLFVILHLSIPENTEYEVVLELDPAMLEEFLEEPEEAPETQEMLAQGTDQMLSNQASAEGMESGSSSGGSSGSSSSGGITGNYGVSPENVEEEVRPEWDWKHDETDGTTSTYVSPFQNDDNTPYVGESTTKYRVGNRHATFEPKPHYLCPGGGYVYINIEVNKAGYVTSAEVNAEESDVTSKCLIDAAEEFAKNFVFSAGDSKDAGYISFIMQAQ